MPGGGGGSLATFGARVCFPETPHCSSIEIAKLEEKHQFAQTSSPRELRF